MTFTASQCSVLSIPTCWMRLLSCYTYKSRLPLRHQGCLQYEYINVERRDGAAFCFQLVCSCNRTSDFLCEPVFLLLSYSIYYVCKVSDFPATNTIIYYFYLQKADKSTIVRTFAKNINILFI